MTEQNNNKPNVILTGIKPSGMPHLGNYCGAIKPMIEAINNKKDNETIYMFIPDIHVINGGLEPAKIREFSYGMLATYLACGLDPEKVVVYRQSAVRQHAELATLLNNFTPKGMMNRAHSYKAAVDKNKNKSNHQALELLNNLCFDLIGFIVEINRGYNLFEKHEFQIKNYIETIKIELEKNPLKDFNNEFLNLFSLLSKLGKEISQMPSFDKTDEIRNISVKNLKDKIYHTEKETKDLISLISTNDIGINMGLYTYPILMAADILLYHTNTVPVGKDQIQHIEMARDIANSFNSRYSQTFTIPNYESKEDAPEIAGLDGRKMSKSYGNHIPMFCNENELKSLVKKIITDSARPEEPKENVESSTIFQLYALFADDAKAADFKARLEAGGFGYGDAKMELFELINGELSAKREKYNELMADRKALEEVLRAGEEKARFVAEKTMRKVRKKMGLVDVV
jgi:tryptophanyl-tRNA synthetase